MVMVAPPSTAACRLEGRVARMSDQHPLPVTFGIKTTPMRVPYQDILRVWQEADELPDIADAWLWDHLIPISQARRTGRSSKDGHC